MGLVELITLVGDDGASVQSLDVVATNLSAAKGLTTITFKTDQPLTLAGTRDLGLVVWLSRDKIKKVLEGLNDPL